MSKNIPRCPGHTHPFLDTATSLIPHPVRTRYWFGDATRYNMIASPLMPSSPLGSLPRRPAFFSSWLTSTQIRLLLLLAHFHADPPSSPLGSLPRRSAFFSS
eukprot:TRINITY_DN6559_c0_g1_i1.p2 TRINITY_DN6559_c0_g1~~TRINITY_DN6559_c0_g1_i1.p2  ORF type:complete len:102 (+),score=7.94 TRINITY_DN6559_c0_g1_i1:103-408(+)